MQYGNREIPAEWYIVVQFKSYYVVWKPTKRASAVPIPTV